MVVFFAAIFAVLAIGLFALAGHNLRSSNKGSYKKSSKKIGLVGLVGGLVMVMLFVFIPFGFIEVKAGEVAVVKVWGEAKEIKTAGLHFRNVVSTKYTVYDTKTQQVNISTDAYSRDAQSVALEVSIQFSINPEDAVVIANTIGTLDVLKDRLMFITQEKSKTVISKKSAMEIIETRHEISPSVRETLIEIEEQYHIKIVNFVVHNIVFNEAFENAVEQKMIAEQEKLKAQYDKEKAIIKAEEELEVARKKAEAVIEEAKGKAQAEIEMASASAKALELLQEAWASITDEDIRRAMLQQMFYEKWDGILPEVMAGDNIDIILGLK